ncbi:MAG TPA: flagellin [Candidatus Binatia bacterium]|nr:flagellin [Candidatus Binatia bacterium]
MALSVLNNIPALVAQNQLQITQNNLQKTLFRLASGSRINSGADDAAGLAIADGLNANIAALNQSASNANDGVGTLQVADGALGQVTTLLQRAVTLATESSTGTVSDSQRTALDAEYTQIKQEIDRIGTSTTFNGAAVFSAATTSIFLSDATATGSNTITVSTGTLSSAGLGLAGNLLTDPTAQTSLTQIDAAIATVASSRGTIGAGINRLQSAANVINVQVQNLTTAEDGIRAADIGVEVGNLSRYSILEQTGISALAQANTQQQAVLNLLR